MPSLYLRLIYAIASCLTVYTIYHFTTRDTNSPELKGMFNRVQCHTQPVDADHMKHNRAFINFDKYGLYFICLSENETKQKNLLKCDTSMQPPLCGNEVRITQSYSLAKDGTIIKASQYTKDLPALVSGVEYIFDQSGFKLKNDRKTNREQFHFGKDDLRHDGKFEFKKDFVCDSQSYALNAARCQGLLSYNDSDILMVVSLIAPDGTKFQKYDAKKNIQLWLKLLSEIVQPVTADD
ncbi:MAG: hypothetical protein Q4P13_01730 [Psychrobacter sp.]|nr:hypothetical protein [Psychrobacter sp.]